MSLLGGCELKLVQCDIHRAKGSMHLYQHKADGPVGLTHPQQSCWRVANPHVNAHKLEGGLGRSHLLHCNKHQGLRARKGGGGGSCAPDVNVHTACTWPGMPHQAKVLVSGLYVMMKVMELHARLEDLVKQALHKGEWTPADSAGRQCSVCCSPATAFVTGTGTSRLFDKHDKMLS